MRLIAAAPFSLVSLLLLCSAAAAGAAVARARAPLANEQAQAQAPANLTPAPVNGAVAKPPIPYRRPARDRSGAPRIHRDPLHAGPESAVARWERTLSKRRDTRVAFERMNVYAPLVRQALTSRAVPDDFMYLPVIESEYRPEATSRAGAAGIWQLMPATARAYGLEVSSWVDERRDPIRSTVAAVRHLRDLHGELGSWHLAAAAYNCGSPRLARTINGARTDAGYWANRHRLPPETRDYVPKLLAAVRLGHLARVLDPAVVPLQFAEVIVPGGVPLPAVAAAYGMSADTLLALNPHLIRRSTPPGRRWPVRIPVLRR